MGHVNSCCGQAPNINAYLPQQQNNNLPFPQNGARNNNGANNGVGFNFGSCTPASSNYPFCNNSRVGNGAEREQNFIKNLVNSDCRSGNCNGKQKIDNQISGKDFDTLSTALQAKNDGSATIKEDAKPLLRKVAIGMDNDPSIKKPDSGSWLNEINEDNYLTPAEAKPLSEAISKYLNRVLTAKDVNTGGPSFVNGFNSNNATRMFNNNGQINNNTERSFLQAILNFLSSIFNIIGNSNNTLANRG